MDGQYISKEKKADPVFKYSEPKQDEWLAASKERFETQQQMYDTANKYTDINKNTLDNHKKLRDEKIEAVKQASPQNLADIENEQEAEMLDELESNAKLESEMKELGNRYDRLFSKGATDVDAKKVREDITKMICRLSGQDIEDLEYLPTDKMDAIIRKNIKNVGKDDLAYIVSEDIDTFRNMFETEENNYAMFKGPIAELSAKRDMTVGEKLRLYEYSLCAVRYTTEMQDLQYNSLYDMRQDKLSSLAMDLLDFAESKNDSFTSMSEETREKHMEAATRLLASVSDEPEELFGHIPLEELSDRTASTFNIMLKNREFMENVKEIIARAKSLQ